MPYKLFRVELHNNTQPRCAFAYSMADLAIRLHNMQFAVLMIREVTTSAPEATAVMAFPAI